MGGRGSRSRMGSTVSPAQPPQVRQATPAPVGRTAIPRNFQPLSRQDESDLQEVYDGYDINLVRAIQQYIRQDQQAGGFTMSQNLNHKLEEGLPLNANEQYVYNQIQSKAHDLGHDTVLVRGAHQDLLEAMGVKNYASMSDSQLSAALTGLEYQERKLVSTAWDASKNPFMSGPNAGGREVYLSIKAPANTKGVIGNMKQTEFILARGTRYRVTGARFARDSRGNIEYAYPRNSGATPRVIIDVEIITD